MKKEIELLNQFKDLEEEYPLWHLSKLITDGEGLKYNCYLCEQPGLGPTYVCERADCQWVAHKSCLEQPLPPGITHDLSYGHRIIFIEELDNQEKVICSFCEELVSGSAYKCLYPGCKFVIHQSCINIPVNLSKHPIDQRHGLYLRGSSKERHCDLCGKLCAMGYICRYCDVAIHIKCASRGIMSVEKCHPHEFIVFPKGECQHTCQACGQQSSEVIYLCRNCRLWIHQNCFKTYPHTVKIKECSHFLTYTISRPNEHMCKLCKELVNKRYAAYICNSCDYITHLWCANASLDSSDVTLLGDDRTVSLQEIKNHFSHPEHNLILSEEQPEHDQYCMGCMDRIVSPPFYSCITCQFFFHEKCAKLPPNIKLFYSPTWAFTLLPKASSTSQFCPFCKRTCKGFVYFCQGLAWTMDIQCSLLQRHLKHEAHQHLLSFDCSEERNCSACYTEMLFYFRCTHCDFGLCRRCATYPLQISHGDHEHFLNLTYKIEDDFGEYYCLICEEKRDPSNWFYYCQKCDFAAHLDCAYLRT